MFDSDKYSSLLSQYQPRIIKNEDENERFLEIVESLLSAKISLQKKILC